MKGCNVSRCTGQRLPHKVIFVVVLEMCAAQLGNTAFSAFTGLRVSEGHHETLSTILSTTMVTAKDRTLNTVEIFELIVLRLPLKELLRAQRVSRSWQHLINQTILVREMTSSPYISVPARLYNPLSESEDELRQATGLPVPVSIRNDDLRKPAMLEVDMILYADRPMTISILPTCPHSHAQIFHKYQAGSSPPSTLPPMYWRSSSCCGDMRFDFDGNRQRQWLTMYPGRCAYTTGYSFRSWKVGGCERPLIEGSLGGTEVGKVYVL